MKKLFIPALTALLSLPVSAVVPNTFVAGTPAKASEVNANFGDMDDRINVLEAGSSTFNLVTFTPISAAIGDVINLGSYDTDMYNTDNLYRYNGAYYTQSEWGVFLATNPDPQPQSGSIYQKDKYGVYHSRSGEQYSLVSEYATEAAFTSAVDAIPLTNYAVAWVYTHTETTQVDSKIKQIEFTSYLSGNSYRIKAPLRYNESGQNKSYAPYSDADYDYGYNDVEQIISVSGHPMIIGLYCGPDHSPNYLSDSDNTLTVGVKDCRFNIRIIVDGRSIALFDFTDGVNTLTAETVNNVIISMADKYVDYVSIEQLP